MGIYIKSVTITPNVVNTGSPVFIRAIVEETKWNDLKNDFPSWGEVGLSFANWEAVRNYIPEPYEVDDDRVLSSDGFTLFCGDCNQISISGGAVLDHTAEVIDQFVKEVKENE